MEDSIKKTELDSEGYLIVAVECGAGFVPAHYKDGLCYRPAGGNLWLKTRDAEYLCKGAKAYKTAAGAIRAYKRADQRCFQ